MKINYDAIGKAIRDFRIRQEMTQEELSEYSGISPGYLSKIESGYSKPSLETLVAISFSLGISLNDIVYSDEHLENFDLSSRMINDLLEKCNLNEKNLTYIYDGVDSVISMFGLSMNDIIDLNSLTTALSE